MTFLLSYLLKEIAFQIALSLAMVFQASFNQCKLAADWKVAHMVPACIHVFIKVTNHHFTTIQLAYFISLHLLMPQNS